ncbi:MAG: hypothetical protein R3Y22_07420 [Bacteroidales bacterium]
MSADDIKVYDEDDALEFIQKFIPQETKGKYSNDDILNLLDIMFDYYEDKGLFDIDLSDDDEADIDIDELVKYVQKVLAKDKDNKVAKDDVMDIVLAELEYEKSLGMYE